MGSFGRVRRGAAVVCGAVVRERGPQPRAGADGRFTDLPKSVGADSAFSVTTPLRAFWVFKILSYIYYNTNSFHLLSIHAPDEVL